MSFNLLTLFLVLPRFTPLTLGRTRDPFDHPAWVFELKYDGFRALLYLDRGRAKIVSRNGNHMKRFDALAGELAQDIRVREAIVDGEICCLDRKGRPDFNALFYGRGKPCFVAFDLLYMNGRDYREHGLLARKSRLSIAIGSSSACALNAQYVLERGVDLYRTVCKRDLEGIVAKHGSRNTWHSGRSRRG